MLYELTVKEVVEAGIDIFTKFFTGVAKIIKPIAFLDTTRSGMRMHLSRVGGGSGGTTQDHADGPVSVIR